MENLERRLVVGHSSGGARTGKSILIGPGYRERFYGGSPARMDGVMAIAAGISSELPPVGALSKREWPTRARLVVTPPDHGLEKTDSSVVGRPQAPLVHAAVDNRDL